MRYTEAQALQKIPSDKDMDDGRNTPRPVPSLFQQSVTSRMGTTILSSLKGDLKKSGGVVVNTR